MSVIVALVAGMFAAPDAEFVGSDSTSASMNLPRTAGRSADPEGPREMPEFGGFAASTRTDRQEPASTAMSQLSIQGRDTGAWRSQERTRLSLLKDSAVKTGGL